MRNIYTVKNYLEKKLPGCLKILSSLKLKFWVNTMNIFWDSTTFIKILLKDFVSILGNCVCFISDDAVKHAK